MMCEHMTNVCMFKFTVFWRCVFSADLNSWNYVPSLSLCHFSVPFLVSQHKCMYLCKIKSKNSMYYIFRCWRRFVRLRRTTFSLTKSYNDLEISLESVRSMPFEKLALQMESANTIQTVKALLDRFESRLMISHAATPTRSLSNLENIDNLLMRVTSPKRRGNTNNRGVNRVGSIREGAQRQVKLSRYLVRVVLCAYMILGHPDAVFSEKGEHEIALAESAATFVQEFELLIKIISDGPTHTTQGGTNSSAPNQLTFRSQLETFDRSWCSYLYSFVAWKVKDAKLLEEDLVKAASQLEVSMMQNCKLTPEGDNGSLSHDMKAIQKQVLYLAQLFLGIFC